MPSCANDSPSLDAAWTPPSAGAVRDMHSMEPAAALEVRFKTRHALFENWLDLPRV